MFKEPIDPNKPLGQALKATEHAPPDGHPVRQYDIEQQVLFAEMMEAWAKTPNWFVEHDIDIPDFMLDMIKKIERFRKCDKPV